MIKKIKLFVILLFILTSNSNLLYSQTNIKIIYKINNKIITNIDIENEAKYLIALNNQLERLDPKKISYRVFGRLSLNLFKVCLKHNIHFPYYLYVI